MVEVTENLSIHYRPDLNILFCRFTQPVTSGQLRNAYEQAFTMAQQKQAYYWLLDLRRRGPIQEEDRNWILTEFIPRIEACTGLHQYFAYLITPIHSLQLKDVINPVILADFSPMTKIRIFDSEEKAVVWLISNQGSKIEIHATPV